MSAGEAATGMSAGEAATNAGPAGSGAGGVWSDGRTALLARIVPDPVAAEEAFEDPEHVRLFPAEEELIAKAVDKRRREFGTARHCARAYASLASCGAAAAAASPPSSYSAS